MPQAHWADYLLLPGHVPSSSPLCLCPPFALCLEGSSLHLSHRSLAQCQVLSPASQVGSAAALALFWSRSTSSGVDGGFCGCVRRRDKRLPQSSQASLLSSQSQLACVASKYSHNPIFSPVVMTEIPCTESRRPGMEFHPDQVLSPSLLCL